MAGFSGREMCLSQSQPLDHINTFDLAEEEGGRGWGGGETGKNEGWSEDKAVVGGRNVQNQHNISQFTFGFPATFIPGL